MIATRQQMLACIKKTIQQATAEEKRQLRQGLLKRLYDWQKSQGKVVN